MGGHAVVQGDFATAGLGVQVVDVEAQDLVLAVPHRLQVHQLEAQQGQLALEGGLDFFQIQGDSGGTTKKVGRTHPVLAFGTPWPN